MGNIFGHHGKHPKETKGSQNKAAAAAKVSDQDRAILKLKKQRDNLTKHRQKVEAQGDKLQAGAKARAKNGDKAGALSLLKLRRYQVAQIETVDGQLLNLETMCASMEFAVLNAQVVEGIEQGNKALAALNEACSIERVEEIMFDMQEGIEYSAEVTAMLSATDGDGVTDEALQAELDEMAAMMAAELGGDAEAASTPAATTTDPTAAAETVTADMLPAAPTDALPAVQTGVETAAGVAPAAGAAAPVMVPA